MDAGWIALMPLALLTAAGLATCIRDWVRHLREERRHTRLIGLGGHVWMPGWAEGVPRPGVGGAKGMSRKPVHTGSTQDTSGTGNGNG